MVGELDVSPIVPPHGSDSPAPSFARQGPVGSVPPRPCSYDGAPTSRPPAALLTFVRPFRPCRRRRDLPGSWAALAYVPWPLTPVEPHAEVPGSCPAFDMPVSPSAITTTSASTTSIFRGSIPRPIRPLSTLRAHGRPCTAHEHARLASAPATSGLGRGDSHPGLLSKFWVLLPSSPTRLVLAHCDECSVSTNPPLERPWVLVRKPYGL